jgi:hypothetical protein
MPVPATPFWLVTVGVPWQPTESADCPANLKFGLPEASGVNFHACRGAPVWQKLFSFNLVICNSVETCILDITTFRGVAASATVERPPWKNDRLENFSKLAGFRKDSRDSSALTSVGSTTGSCSFRISRCYISPVPYSPCL